MARIGSSFRLSSIPEGARELQPAPSQPARLSSVVVPPLNIRILAEDDTHHAAMLECLVNYYGAGVHHRAWSARARDGISSPGIAEGAALMLSLHGLPDDAIKRNSALPPSAFDMIVVLDDPGSTENLRRCDPREKMASPRARIISHQSLDPKGRGIQAYQWALTEFDEFSGHELGFFIPQAPRTREVSATTPPNAP